MGSGELPVRLSAQYLLVWVEERPGGSVVVLDDRGVVVEVSAHGSQPERAAMGCMRAVTALESYTNDLLRRASHPVTGPNVAVVGNPDEIEGNGP